MSDPRVKKEGGASSSTTIGGAQKVQFAPRIPVRRKTTDGSVAAATSELRDLITTKVEKKMAPRANTRAAPVATAARVAFQPSGGPGQGQSMSSGEELRDVAMIVTHQTGARIPGQHVEPEGDVKAKRLGVKKEGDASLVGEGELSAEELAELSAEAELNEMLARENAYDQFLDNGDARQYRPVLLPFPVVRLGTQGSSSAARSASASPVEVSRPNSFGAATNMFDIDEAEQSPPAAAVVPPIRTAASDASAPYKALPLNTPARLLGQIDHEEKLNGGAVPSARNILFFQFPSHLPFKQAASWAPPVNPLLALNGAHRQGAGATVFGDAARGPQAAASSAASSAAQNVAASPSLQALHALSSPALPPLQASLGMPNLSLGAPSSGVGSKVGGVPSSGLMDDVGTSSALATEEEQDLGEVSKNDPNKLSESERLARDHKARQQRKLLLFSSNFEHAMRHLPAGQLGSLVIYKSGKIKMRIGDVLLDVNEGVQALFHQELMSVQAGTGDAYRLGPVAHRLVCTNDVEDLVRKSRERAVPQANAHAE